MAAWLDLRFSSLFFFLAQIQHCLSCAILCFSLLPLSCLQLKPLRHLGKFEFAASIAAKGDMNFVVVWLLKVFLLPLRSYANTERKVKVKWYFWEEQSIVNILAYLGDSIRVRRMNCHVSIRLYCLSALIGINPIVRWCLERELTLSKIKLWMAGLCRFRRRTILVRFSHQISTRPFSVYYFC